MASEIAALGGEALPLAVDIRDDRAVVAAVERFGGIDVLVNNASALNLSRTLDIPMARFDLMFAVNVRGTLGSPHRLLKTAR